MLMRALRPYFGLPSWPFLLLAAALLILAVLGVPFPPVDGRGSSVTASEERAWSEALSAWISHGGFRYGLDSFLWLAIALGVFVGASVRGDHAFKDTLRAAVVCAAVLVGLLVVPSILLALEIPLTNFDPSSDVTEFTEARLFMPIIAALIISVVAAWDAIRFLDWRRHRKPPGRHAAVDAAQDL